MRPSVLVVDDERAILEVLEMRLGALGYDVTVTTEPARALAALEARRFDAALVDLRMDAMDGIALMEAIHARQSRLPVLIMTAHGTIENAVEAIRRGAFDYLTKPFVRDELATKLDRALATRRWARDRERLLAVGQTLASSGVMARVLDAVARAALEATEAERCVVFQQEHGRLAPMAQAGSAAPAWAALEGAATAAMDKGAPVTVAGPGGGAVVAAPLVVARGVAGALVIETAARVVPDDDDLELLALFSSQAAVAIGNAHELERLRSGALAALGRMATQVAHELRNPLAGLRLYARHLEQRLEKSGDAEGADLARKISSTIAHLAGVVSDITAFGKTSELRRAPLDLHPLLDECVALARARCPVDDVEVRCRYDARCPPGMLDARELRKAFLNLIVNGLEALRPGGRLDVSTSWDADAGVATVSVVDDGVGMSEETVARLFDLFYTTKTDGTGLGMAIARAALEAHGGGLTVTSVLGRGTTLTARLPLAPAREGA